jgi:hypothetical protein
MAKAPKNTGAQGFTHTSTPTGSGLKNPGSMPMSMPGESATKPTRNMSGPEMRAMMDETGTGGGQMESM